MLVNKIKEIVYCSIGKKILAFNAVIKFKLSNLERIYINIIFLSLARKLQLSNMAAGGKIKTKVKLLC